MSVFFNYVSLKCIDKAKAIQHKGLWDYVSLLLNDTIKYAFNCNDMFDSVTSL